MKVSFLEFTFLAYSAYRCVHGIRATRRREKGQFFAIPSRDYYALTVGMTASFTAFALLTAVTSGIPVFGLGRIDGRSFLLGIAFLILVLCLDPLEWKFTPAENRRRVTYYLPRTARERVSWVFVCIAVGVGEEIIYRAVLFGILFRITGEYWTAAIASAVLFALAHFSQGWLALASTAFVAICLQWLVKISGGLYIAMGIHFMHNLFNGILWGALTRPEPEGKRTEEGTAGNTATNPAADQPAGNPDTAVSPAD